MFDIIETFFPMLVVFLLLRGILQTLLRSGRRSPQPENDGGYEDDDMQEDEQESAVPPETPKQPDLAAEFERRLKKTSAGSASAKEQPQSIRTGRQRVHRDDEVLHEGKGRIHKEGEALVHDRGKVYYDPKGDYSYNEERFNAQAAAFRARYAARQEELRKPRLQLKHSALVKGFIMSQVLEKPRSLNPYGTEEQL